jgi:uncharacterized damage-inducible protein DinB
LLDLNNPYSVEDILAATERVSTHVGDAFAALAPDTFTYQTDGVWSAQQSLEHLLLTTKPVAKALKLPPERLEKMFGRSERSSHDYDTIVAAYRKKLNGGLRAEGSSFDPITFKMPEDIDDEQTYLVEEYRKTARRLIEVVDTWSDGDLDAYLLPHPVDPEMTVREMLLFTLYHNLHHLNDVEQLLQA